MTNKDYKLIAECLNKATKQQVFKKSIVKERPVVLEFLATIIDNLIAELKRDNPRFDRDKFIEAVYEGLK